MREAIGRYRSVIALALVLFALAAVTAYLVPRALPLGFPQDTITGIVLVAPVATVFVILLVGWIRATKIRGQWVVVSIGVTAISVSVAQWGFR